MKNYKRTRVVKVSIYVVTFFFMLASYSLGQNIDTFFQAAPKVVTDVSRIIIGIMTIMVFWGFVRFMFQDKKEEGKNFIIWGIIGIFVAFSIWAIISFLQKSTIGNGGSIPNPPTIN